MTPAFAYPILPGREEACRHGARLPDAGQGLLVMGWLGFHDLAGRHRHVPEDGGPDAENPLFSDDLITRGTILAELDMSRGGRVPARLLAFESARGWTRQLTLWLNADETLSVEIRQGPARSYARLDNPPSAGGGRWRLSIIWDGPGRAGHLALFSPENARMAVAPLPAPPPLPGADLRAIVEASGPCEADPRVTFLAVAEGHEPAGPAAGIAAGAMADTPDGPRPVERLQRGDVVLTASGAPKPIRWTFRQALPAAGPFTPVMLRAPYFGLSRDIVVTAGTRLMISGPDAEYHFGEEAVLAEAGSLAAHPAVHPCPADGAITCHQFLFDEHECLSLSGACVESLFIGTLGARPALRAVSMLAPLPPSALPLHRRLAGPVLRPFESRSLASEMRA